MIKIHRSKNNQFYFTILSTGNWKVLATSETYKSKRNCIDGIIALIGQLRDEPYKIYDHSSRDEVVTQVKI